MPPKFTWQNIASPCSSKRNSDDWRKKHYEINPLPCRHGVSARPADIVPRADKLRSLASDATCLWRVRLRFGGSVVADFQRRLPPGGVFLLTHRRNQDHRQLRELRLLGGPGWPDR